MTVTINNKDIELNMKNLGEILTAYRCQQLDFTDSQKLINFLYPVPSTHRNPYM